MLACQLLASLLRQTTKTGFIVPAASWNILQPRSRRHKGSGSVAVCALRRRATSVYANMKLYGGTTSNRM